MILPLRTHECNLVLGANAQRFSWPSYTAVVRTIRYLQSASGLGGSIVFSVGNRGVQTSHRQWARIALDLAFYCDADTILLNNPSKDEFLDTRDYDGAWWLASTAVLAFLTFKDVINSNRLFFLHAFTWWDAGGVVDVFLVADCFVPCPLPRVVTLGW